ncbi:unnamed protein product [Euphydryas editha]|uniref:Uncharacterized protein n=1 Tax=Euphydryas editha TaxID=104508 RepID=A0AAU9U837_EUPED|nr:unnamed protein product [Euphydryas editha]
MAATLLVNDPPWELQAEVLGEVYRFRSSLRCKGQVSSADQTAPIRAQAQRALIQWWKEDLESIRPHLRRWVRRRHGVLTFRLADRHLPGTDALVCFCRI